MFSKKPQHNRKWSCSHCHNISAHISRRSLLLHQRQDKQSEAERPSQHPENLVEVYYHTRMWANIRKNRGFPAWSDAKHITWTPAPTWGIKLLLEQRASRPSEVQPPTWGETLYSIIGYPGQSKRGKKTPNQWRQIHKSAPTTTITPNSNA